MLVLEEVNMQIYLDSKEVLMMKISEEKEEEVASEVATEVASEVETEVATEAATEAVTEVATEVATELAMEETEHTKEENCNSMKMLSQLCDSIHNQ